MAIFLNERETRLNELMEDPDCNRSLLFNTYRQFETINKLLSGWKNLYKLHIRPVLSSQKDCSLLDIGFGGGDLPLFLHKWAEQDGYSLHITAIETDQRALEYIQHERSQTPAQIDFIYSDIDHFFPIDKPYDFVISNHLIHHLSSDELYKLASKSQNLARHKVIFNDLQRNDLAYFLFSFFIGPFFRNSFAAIDGRRSIRRSFTRSELADTLPNDWTVERQFPFRLIAIHESA